MTDQKNNDQEYVYYNYREDAGSDMKSEKSGNEIDPIDVWSYPRKPKGGLNRKWTLILVATVALGSLLYAADTNNWFTNHLPQAVSLNAPSATDGADAGVASQVVRPGNISSIVKATSGAIVKIETYQTADNRTNNSYGNSFFDQFFGDQQQDTNEQGMIASGIGSGFIFDKEGYILTNQHVIEGADEIQVTLEGYDKPFVAKLLGSTFDLDLAVLKIEGAKAFPYLALGDDARVSVGDWLVAVGNPYGFDHTVTVGVLSAKERPIDITENNATRKYRNLLQTDASINPGNSGGPLLNLNGEVVGINTAVSSQAQGIGFAIPMSTVNTVLDNLKKDVKIPKPYIGIYMSNIDQSWLTELNLADTNGVLVQSIVDGSPAAKAGMKAYDVILKYNSKLVKDTDELSKLISQSKVGSNVQLMVMRDGKKITLRVTIGNQNK
jgi:S1-C subfamily serine protease